MDYKELIFRKLPEQWSTDLLVVALGENGFDSFEELDEQLKAYIPIADYDESALHQNGIIKQAIDQHLLAENRIKAENWNARWENSFEPVVVDDRCVVRATFHPSQGQFEHEIVIDPKMSFGTGHHQTTYLMLKALLDLDVTGTSFLDMGCGTGILAILAARMHAAKVLAIDYDEWAYNNAVENVKLNDCEQIDVVHGDVSFLQNHRFNIILANINKNIVLRDLEHYSNHLLPGGILLLSGFYESDAADVTNKAMEYSLVLRDTAAQNDWTMLKFEKENTP